MPKLTIVTISYQNLNGLRKTIEGLQSQSCFDFEHWVIDGQSTDGTQDYLKNLKVPWDLHWLSEKDNGRYEAMNKGTQKATGEYIWYLNAGDFPADAHVIDDLISISSAKSQYDLIYGKIIFDSPFGQQISGHQVSAKDFKFGMPISHPGVLFKSSLLKKQPYRTDFRIISDWLLIKNLWSDPSVTAYFYDRIFTIFDVEGVSSQNLILDLKEKVHSETALSRKTEQIFFHGTKILILSLLKKTGIYPSYKKWKSRHSQRSQTSASE